MSKRSIWKRINRGFLVSMVLLAGVLIYILVTQLMLIPERRELRELADSVRQISDAMEVQEDGALNKLKDAVEQTKEQEQIRKELEPYFVKDSSYLDVAAKTFLNDVVSQIEGERLTSLQLKKNASKVESCTIDGDTATIRMYYAFTVSGYFYDYNDISGKENGEMKLKKAEDTDQYMRLYLTCKKVDGQWKVFRISEYYRYVNNHNMSFTEVMGE